MNTKHNLHIVTLAVILVAGLAARGGAEPIAARELPVGDSRSQGSWKVDKADRAHHAWKLDVRREADDRIAGRVDLGTSALARYGNVAGTIRGSVVSGQISDDSGVKIATFRGEVDSDGIRGTYVDRSGESGAWSWQGRLE